MKVDNLINRKDQMHNATIGYCIQGCTKENNQPFYIYTLDEQSLITIVDGIHHQT